MLRREKCVNQATDAMLRVKKIGARVARISETLGELYYYSEKYSSPSISL